MSNTTFVWEADRSTDGEVRITLTMDGAELAALGDVARAAADAAVLLPDDIDEITEHNAMQLYKWSQRTASALDHLASTASGKE